MLRRECLKSKSGLIIQPIRFYQELNKDIEVGDVVLARVVDFFNSKIYLNLGDFDAYMDLNDFDYYYCKKQKIASIYGFMGKNLIARVLKKEKNCIFLERNSIAEETIKTLSEHIGDIIPTTIERLNTFGVFVDIGNGISSLIHGYELTNMKYSEYAKSLTVGDEIDVKIVDYNSENFHFSISHKQIYRKLNEDILPKKTLFDVTCLCFVNQENDGVFVEYDLNNIGIVDIPTDMPSEEFRFGRRMCVSLRSYKNGNFKAKFYCFLD